MKKLFLVIFFCVSLDDLATTWDCMQDQMSEQNIIIRRAQIDDLQELFDLDRRVSFEYFKPMYVEGYAHLAIGKNPDYYLEMDLENDREIFPDCILYPEDRRFLVAEDTANKRLAGFLIFSKIKHDTIELQLLLVDKTYRGQGIGKKLVQHSYTAFPRITTCIVYPCQFANESTLKFYEALGFKNMGIPQHNALNMYNIRYADMYFLYTLDLKK